MLGQRAINNRLNKALEDYNDYQIKEYTGTSVHIFTETESITLICDTETGKVEKKSRLRRGKKNKTKVDAPSSDIKSGDEQLPGQINLDEALAEIKKIQKEKEIDADDSVTKKHIISYCEGDIVESIYTGKRYTVVNNKNGMLQIRDKELYALYTVAASDFLKVVNG